MNKITFIGYPKCSTCKKAYQTLEDLGIHAEYRDITKKNPTVEEIKSWIDRGVELKQLFNTSGQLYRKLDVKTKRQTYSDDQLIELLASDGMLVKRPIVVSDDTIIIGNRPDAYATLK
ncbi:MAG: Spx/MgsR family RNA polymerase-binding regulatory protein [Absicoccus porci]|uniref:Spx/MgsR family RNA polymerase-binding regulatory protein n=1 Tax=Absicoccus porci TaxID=2486576 RepID=UPI0023523F34|nr:Spx/MgsR family RNA polymerase-binding regulatory protein [Absicoccus porci]MCI6087600.1 Spx/MgsR family RNA polymerase-binding regulatory protein [Absicoccus porci]